MWDGEAAAESGGHHKATSPLHWNRLVTSGAHGCHEGWTSVSTDVILPLAEELTGQPKPLSKVSGPGGGGTESYGWAWTCTPPWCRATHLPLGTNLVAHQPVGRHVTPSDLEVDVGIWVVHGENGRKLEEIEYLWPNIRGDHLVPC